MSTMEEEVLCRGLERCGRWRWFIVGPRSRGPEDLSNRRPFDVWPGPRWAVIVPDCRRKPRRPLQPTTHLFIVTSHLYAFLAHLIRCCCLAGFFLLSYWETSVAAQIIVSSKSAKEDTDCQGQAVFVPHATRDWSLAGPTLTNPAST